VEARNNNLSSRSEKRRQSEFNSSLEETIDEEENSHKEAKKGIPKMKNNQLTKNLLICGDNLKALDDLKKQDVKDF